MLWVSARPWEKRQELGGGRLVPPQLTGLRTAQPILPPSLLPLSCPPRKAACSLVISRRASPRSALAGSYALLSPPAPSQSYPVLPGTALNAALCPRGAGGLRQVSASPRMGPACFWGPWGVQSPKFPPSPLLPRTNSTRRAKRTGHW